MGIIKANQLTTKSTNTTTSRLWLLISSLILISFPLLFLVPIFPHLQLIDKIRFEASHPSTLYPIANKTKPPKWLKAIREAHLTRQRPLKVGLVNFEATEQSHLPVGGIAEYITIHLERVSNNVTWKRLFPEWINEGPGDQCPTIPMPRPGEYSGLDVVVAKLPCRGRNNGYGGSNEEGVRDVHRLQVSLVTAQLIVENGDNNGKDDGGAGGGGGGVYGVFISKCEPMVELFKCDDLVWHRGSYWVYKPQVHKLKELINMPLGTCHLASPSLDTSVLQDNLITSPIIRPKVMRREAYVTVLHSSETYVCGAIALATSILQTNTTKDLIALVDHTISDHSLNGLKVAGWKIKRINRIESPSAKANAYNKWNYSKLRVWQLVEYDKVMFIDSDFIVLQNIDHFFDYPQLSAGPNHDWLFNSGIMILEPSECLFKNLMRKRYTMKSYNGGDQGFLNEIFTWWHRLTKRLNFMKLYGHGRGGDQDRLVPMDRYTIHYLGFKPWLCYRDYDCNWDRLDHHRFASDDLHARWWSVYDGLPKKLQTYCGLTKELSNVLHTRRLKAQKMDLYDEHWKIDIKDPRVLDKTFYMVK